MVNSDKIPMVLEVLDGENLVACQTCHGIKPRKNISKRSCFMGSGDMVWGQKQAIRSPIGFSENGLAKKKT